MSPEQINSYKINIANVEAVSPFSEKLFREGVEPLSNLEKIIS